MRPLLQQPVVIAFCLLHVVILVMVNVDVEISLIVVDFNNVVVSSIVVDFSIVVVFSSVEVSNNVVVFSRNVCSLVEHVVLVVTVVLVATISRTIPIVLLSIVPFLDQAQWPLVMCNVVVEMEMHVVVSPLTRMLSVIIVVNVAT